MNYLAAGYGLVADALRVIRAGRLFEASHVAYATEVEKLRLSGRIGLHATCGHPRRT